MGNTKKGNTGLVQVMTVITVIATILSIANSVLGIIEKIRNQKSKSAPDQG